MVEIKEILRLWTLGHGLRTIARRTRTDRKTVRRYLDVAREFGLSLDESDKAIDDLFVACVVAQLQPGAPSKIGVMRDHCRAHAGLIDGWRNEGCRGPKIARLLHRHSGVRVPLRTLQRFIQEELTGSVQGTVRVVDGKPGVLEVDFLQFGEFQDLATGKTRMMYALLCTAALSRHQFVWPCLTQNRDAVIEGLEAAWDFFGGVFPVLLPDNTKAMIEKADEVDPVINQTFLEYAQSRGFEIDPARVRKPKDKARVERQVRYVRDDFFCGETFGSVGEARIEARRWCLEEAGTRTHGRTRRRPVEAFEELERSALKPAPTEAYDEPRWGTYHLGRDHAVVVDYALYSVPYTVSYGELRVRSDRRTVKFYRGAVLIKAHPRQPSGGSLIDAVDLPPGKMALATRDATSLIEQAAAKGEHIGIYAQRLAEGPLPWSRMRHVYRLLGLMREYGATATDEACARALEVDVVDVKRIKGMLEKGLSTRRLVRAAQPTSPAAQVLRFARPKSSFGTGGPDAAS